MDTLKIYKMIGSTIENLRVLYSMEGIEKKDKEYLLNTIRLAKKDLERLENGNLSNEELNELNTKYTEASTVVSNILSNLEDEEKVAAKEEETKKETENKKVETNENEEVKEEVEEEVKEVTNNNEVTDADFEVITENTPVETKNETKLTAGDKRLIAGLGAAIVAAGIGVGVLVHESKKLDAEIDAKNAIYTQTTATPAPTPTVVPITTPTPTPVASTNVSTYFIDSYDENVVNETATKFICNNLTSDQVIKAVRLGNFDYLYNQNIFASRDEVLNSISNLGTLVCKFGSDTLLHKDVNSDIYISENTLNEICNYVAAGEITSLSFADAKTDKGYDIYNVYEICVKNIYTNDYNSNFYFAKVLNELTARKFMSYSLTPNSPIATYYVLAGIYESNVNQINSLTSGHNLGPIYGDGTTIDGTYGFVCSEELVNYMNLTNTDNYIYSVVIDDNIVSSTRKY